MKKGKGLGGIVAWGVTTLLVGALLITANVLLTGQFHDIIATVLGDRGRMEIVGENGNIFELDEGITDKASAKENGNKVNIKIVEEGITLLKNKDNNALPLAKGAKVSVFGKNSSDVAIGGGGSGSADKEGMVDFFTALKNAGFEYNSTLKAFYDDNSKSGEGRNANNSDLDSGSTVELSESFVGETELSKYTDDLFNSCEQYKDAALVVLTRIGGEGADLPRTASDHALKLRPAEKDLINKVKTMGFGKVVILLNTAAAMELGELQNDSAIDAILWFGYDGTSGLTALGEILKGETNDGQKISPSGKTVDIYPADFTKDPTWNNFGGALGAPNNKISGDAYYVPSGRAPKDTKVYFTDYEEGIYYGYRYYETAHAEGFINYDEAVVYPFGYGLSYTNFSWSLKNKASIPTTLAKDTAMTFEVEVTNTGTYPGRDTVEIYVTPHYNRGGLDKSAKVLVGFDKTELLKPGEKETLKITIDSPYSYASYDYLGITGQKGYVVEAGNDYLFTISTDSHHAKEMEDAVITASIASDIRYDKDPVTGKDVKNLYSDNADITLNSDAQLGSIMHRNDFAGTWPTTRTAEEKTVDTGAIKEGWDISSAWIEKMKSTADNPNNPIVNETVTMPTTGADNGLKIFDVIGLDPFDNETVLPSDHAQAGKTPAQVWDLFMDQLTKEEMKDLLNKGAFKTEAISRFGIPPTDNTDGPVGWVNFMDRATFSGTCSYCCEVVVASTWNIDRVYDMGRAVGNEGLVGSNNTGRPYTGWYAPGLNIHRSPFGGRNFEYYSEDPLLSGVYAASISKGTWSKGCYTSLKHFAVNETETHRSSNGLLTWIDEQNLRENYLKGFEIAVKGGVGDTNSHAYFGEQKDAKPVSIMTSFNRIGERWTGGDYRLNTSILREEWGFRGFLICDFNTCTHMNCKDMFYSGNDLNLESAGIRVWTPDFNDARDVSVMRTCSKNILYVVSMSNAIRGDFILHMPTWQVLMYVGTGVIAAGLITWGVFAFLKFFKGKKAVEAAE
jgi:beta-glucosidase